MIQTVLVHLNIKSMVSGWIRSPLTTAHFEVGYQVLPRPYDSFVEGQISIVKDEAQIEAFKDVADDVVSEIHVGLEGPADQSVVLLLALGDVEDESVENAVAADEEGL